MIIIPSFICKWLMTLVFSKFQSWLPNRHCTTFTLDIFIISSDKPDFQLTFFLNNQPDALIIQIYSVIKLSMFRGIFFVHHQEFPTVHSALLSFM